MRLTSTVTLISRTSSFGTNQCLESISSTIPDRRSLVGVCKPLRSSPLAGSVFQADETIAEVKETTKLKPSRIVSTPDFASIPIPPPVAKRSRPRTAEGSQNIFVTSVPRPTSPDTVKESTVKESAVSHAFYSGNSAKQASTHLGRSASSAQSSSSAFPTPAVCPPTRKAGSTPHLRAAFRSPCIVRSTTPPPLLSSKKPSAGRSSSIHRNPGDNSWLIANPYEVTPKFTRLGLASPHVVLPLCAKEHSHLARQNSKSSVKTSTARISRVRSTNSSSGTSLSSRSQQDALNSSSPSSTKCDLSNRASEPCSLHLPQTSVAPITSSGTAVTSEGEASDLQYPSASKSDHYARSAPTVRTSRTSPLVRLKNLTLRTFKSSASLKKLNITPIIENLTPAADIRLQGEIKIGLLTPRSSSPTASESTADTKATVVGEFLPPTSRTEQSAKKFWKPFVIWHRNRSMQT